MDTKQPTVLSLFSGLGGFDLGLEAAGFRSVGCVEIDESARRSLKANRGDDWPILEPYDIREFASVVEPGYFGMQPGELDLIAAAPPCQPFSKAAQWSQTSCLGLGDERGNLIFNVLDVVARLRPKLVVLENVRGFIQGKGSVLPDLQRGVAKLNEHSNEKYTLDSRVLNANGFGVPQRRDRAIIVLSRIGRLSLIHI